MMRSLLKQSGIYSSALFTSRLISFATFILFARRLGPTEFGRYVFFITIIQIVTFIADAGLGQWYQKNVEEKNHHHFFASTITARLITLVGSILFSGILLSVYFTFDRWLIFLFICAMSMEAMLSVGEYFYFEKRQSHVVGYKQIGRSVLLVIFYFAAVHIFNFQVALMAYITSSLLILLWFFPWHTISHLRLHHVKNSHIVLKASIPYALLSITSLVYARADTILIGLFRGNAAVGLYSAAYRFLEALSLIPQALSQNLFPISAKMTLPKHSLVKLTGLMGVFGFGIAISLFVSSPAIIAYFVGDAYLSALPILKILSIVLFLFFINAPLATVIQSSLLVKKFLPWGMANTFANIALNIIFIPLFGMTATAWVMLFTELTGLIINIYFIHKIYAK